MFGVLAALTDGCGGDDERDATWSYIAPVIVVPTCATASCHNQAAAVAGLDMSTPEKAYDALTAQRVVVGTGKDRKLCARPLISPGNPAQSRVVNMLRARGAQRMPPDRPLSEPDILLIEKWILEGAEDDLGGGGGGGGGNSGSGGSDGQGGECE
jgi:uncharacterized membrane protein YgcG